MNSRLALKTTFHVQALPHTTLAQRAANSAKNFLMGEPLCGEPNLLDRVRRCWNEPAAVGLGLEHTELARRWAAQGGRWSRAQLQPHAIGCQDGQSG